MEIITRQRLANKVPYNWMSFSPHYNLEVKEKLDALGDVKNPDEVDRIIGNNSWTIVPSCTECCYQSY